jgi:hypothetical protein
VYEAPKGGDSDREGDSRSRCAGFDGADGWKDRRSISEGWKGTAPSRTRNLSGEGRSSPLYWQRRIIGEE